jgi:hypothetical protein
MVLQFPNTLLRNIADFRRNGKLRQIVAPLESKPKACNVQKAN